MTISKELALVVRRYPELRELLETSERACRYYAKVQLTPPLQAKYQDASDQLRAILSPPNIAHLRIIPPPPREGNRGPDAGSD